MSLAIDIPKCPFHRFHHLFHLLFAILTIPYYYSNENLNAAVNLYLSEPASISQITAKEVSLKIDYKN